MQTKCPHFQTVFKVSDEHLKVADGYVRCGICKEVFNALEKVPQLDHTEAAEKVTKPDSADLSTPVDETITSNTKDEVEADDSNDAQADLFAQIADKNKAEVDTADAIETKTTNPKTVGVKTAETEAVSPSIETKTSTEIKTEPEAPIKTPEPASKSTTTDSAPDEVVENKIPENKVRDNNLFDGVQSKLIPDEYRIPELHNTYSIWRDVTWTLAILMLTASLFVEYAWFNRNELISNPQLRPLVTQICLIADCDAMNLREPNAIEMTTRNIYTHPNVDDALMISGTLINHAQFEQPYPSILIDFSDVRGEVIASRIFTPEDYLQIKVGSLKPLAPQASIDFNMEILDPGKQAMTYEFSFL